MEYFIAFDFFLVYPNQRTKNNTDSQHFSYKKKQSYWTNTERVKSKRIFSALTALVKKMCAYI